MKKMNNLAIIPARGGSKGIPRKNLRNLQGKPLIAHAIQACLKADLIDRLVVYTDDEEIGLISERFGAEVVFRPNGSNSSTDEATLDDVIVEAVPLIESQDDCKFDNIITVQPTSPLIRPETIDAAIGNFTETGEHETLISVVHDAHLRWSIEADKILPLYEERVNRQQLPPEYKETGAFLICNRSILKTGTRIGKKISVFVTSRDEAIDIDDLQDFALCEFLLSRKKILFIVAGYNEIGLGHAYRCLTLANALPLAEILFLFEEKSILAHNYIKKYNYTCKMYVNENISDIIEEFSPHLIINDTLDTSDAYMQAINVASSYILNFEDLGRGASLANVVINDLYPASASAAGKNVLSGPDYFCLRDEFTTLKPKDLASSIKEVLLCFGGTDPADLTLRVLNILTELTIFRSIKVTTILGPGYENINKVKEKFGGYKNVTIVSDTKRISDYMYRADLAFTSNGRTVLELSSMNTLTISISQNERETTHLYASDQNGIRNLGLHTTLTDHQIAENFEMFYHSEALRLKYHEGLKKFDVAGGTQRVVGIINDVINGKYEHE